MNRKVTLHAYRYSVYARIARMVLLEKGVPWREIEVDPFSDLPDGYLDLHPFGRVPVLVDGDFTLYETAAISRYVDEAFDGPPLQPADPEGRARVSQIIGIADSYAYWPLVRQVFSHRVFRPSEREPGDQAEIAAGLERAATVLGALDRLCGGAFLVDDRLSLADLHLAPMIGYFVQVPEGVAMLRRFERLSAWWQGMSQRRSFLETEPGLPGSSRADAALPH